MILDGSMRGCGPKIREMAVGMSFLAMGTLTKVSTKTARPMAKELTSGETVKFMMASGRKDRNRAMESGKGYMETAT